MQACNVKISRSEEYCAVDGITHESNSSQPSQNVSNHEEVKIVKV